MRKPNPRASVNPRPVQLDLGLGCSLSGELHCNNLGTAFEERPSERAIAGADIKDKVARANPGIFNDLCSPAANEVMPPPPCPFRGHDAPW
jgi:hypothetical protein